MVSSNTLSSFSRSKPAVSCAIPCPDDNPDDRDPAAAAGGGGGKLDVSRVKPLIAMAVPDWPDVVEP